MGSRAHAVTLATLAWLVRYRRLAVRYDWRADIHQAFLHLARFAHLPQAPTLRLLQEAALR
jgi:hypothetical protein